MTGPTLDWIDWLPIGIRRGAADWEALWCRFGRETALREPFFMDSVATAASWTSGVRPGPSCPNTSTHFSGRS